MRAHVLSLVLLVLPLLSHAAPAPDAPEFTQQKPQAWINSAPLQLADLKGDVVLIEFWTFACASCVHSIPWVKALEERYRGRSFRVIGIHTPEFSFERPAQSVREKVAELGIRHPVMLDNDYAYWNAMGNRYWPAFYLVDKTGHLRYAQAGEVHSGSPAAREVESRIDKLLAE